MKKVVIIGAGASGVIASIFASKNKEVIILERNATPLKKLLLTEDFGRSAADPACQIIHKKRPRR